MVTAPECLATVSPLPENCHSRIQPKQSGSPRKHSQFTERAQRTSLLSAEWLAGAVTASLMTIKEECPGGVQLLPGFQPCCFLWLPLSWDSLAAKFCCTSRLWSSEQHKARKTGRVRIPYLLPYSCRAWAQLLFCVPFSFHHKTGS